MDPQNMEVVFQVYMKNVSPGSMVNIPCVALWFVASCYSVPNAHHRMSSCKHRPYICCPAAKTFICQTLTEHLPPAVYPASPKLLCCHVSLLRLKMRQETPAQGPPGRVEFLRISCFIPGCPCWAVCIPAGLTLKKTYLRQLAIESTRTNNLSCFVRTGLWSLGRKHQISCR